MRVLGRTLAAVLPLLLVCLAVWLVMEGHVSLGAGDKDILLALPLLGWSLAFLLSYVLCWILGIGPARSALYAAIVAMVLLALGWLVALVLSWNWRTG